MDNWQGFVLYFGAPFFGYPFKVPMNLQYGSDYSIAYEHFRRDHSLPWNIFFHFLCLVFQLVNNFGFLAELEKLVGLPMNLLSFSTAAAWSAHLVVHSDAPDIVKAMSVLSLVLAFVSRQSIQRGWLKLMYIQAIVEVLAIQLFVINKVKDTKGKKDIPFDAIQFAGLLAFRWLVQYVVSNKLRGKLVKQRAFVNGVVLAFMGYACLDPWGKVPPFLIGLVGWLLSLLTDQRWLFFYTSGFLATLGQGVAHYYAKQEGTLPQLTNKAHEIAHATFFPNLVFHTIHQSMAESGLVLSAK